MRRAGDTRTSATARTKHELPAFIAPMVAKAGSPFDSDEHLFEIKWDGTRTLAFVERGDYRLVNRRRADMTERYPEMAVLRRTPAGTILDGETVVMRDGKPEFTLLLSREQARNPLKARGLARSLPATYVVFDLLYDAFEPVMDLPLQERRQRLQRLVKRLHEPCVVLSEGIVGRGQAFFRRACEQGLEGVVAKRLQSRYLPGRRSDAWIKIKRGGETICAIIGFIPAGADDFQSLILAGEVSKEIRCVGKVGTGFDGKLRRRLNELLRARPRAAPVVPCKIRGKWVELGLFCKVSYMERTAGGEFRAPVFQELFTELPAWPSRQRPPSR